MNGQMKKYKASLANTTEPILLSQMDFYMDIRGVITYAQSKGVKVCNLSEEEKQAFIKPRKSKI